MHALLLAVAGLAALLPTATAHYQVLYPTWRADSLTNSSVTGFSQWAYPCAGVPTMNDTVRTDWPIDGGSISLKLNHPWTYVVINLGLGANVTNFNLTFTPEFLNATGNGTLCIRKLDMPVKVEDGQLGSIQFITPNERGQALYNCADIRFTSTATVLGPDECQSNNITYYPLSMPANPVSSNGSTTTGGGSGSGSGSGGGTSAGSSTNASLLALTTVVGLAMVFSLGLSL